MPCKRMSPVLTALESEYANRVYIAKINVAYERDLVETYQVRSAPTFLFFKNGEVVERLSGVRKREELEQIINSYLD